MARWIIFATLVVVALWGQAPDPPLPRMAADADPAFAVATIKPHNPDGAGFGIGYRGRLFYGTGASALELILFAYGLHPRQVTGAPGWMAAEKFDIEASSETEGQPNAEQLRTMVRKLLRDRFALDFHRDSKELQVYAIVPAKTGPKFLDKRGDANGRPGFGFQALGSMTVRNATIADFAGWMQRYVLDRPVVDRSGVSGRFNFMLNWTADETQFGGIAGQLPAPDGKTEHSDLYTAMQEQLGLKLESAKAAVEVVVIDRVQKPSEN